MNDEWSRCPICFEDYSLVHRPTTFACGHSTCIDHTSGSGRLQYCPICRCPLQQHEYHVSYNLEEASRLFQLIKNTVDWSTITLPSEPIVNHDQNSTSEMIHRDEIYARRLQANLNQTTVHTPQQTIQSSTTNRVLSAIGMAASSTVSGRNRHDDNRKSCRHQCDLVSPAQCCTCSDRRPHPPDNRYPSYVDGVGTVNRVPRNEFYCSTCKRR